MIGTKSRWVTASVRLAAGAAIALAASSALAGPVMLSVGTSLHKGPGDEYATLASLAPGRIDLGGCQVNVRQEYWCWAERTGQAGWIHVQASDKLKAQGIGEPQSGTSAPQPTAGPRLTMAGNGGPTFGTAGGATFGTGGGSSASDGNRSLPLPGTVDLGGGADNGREMTYRTH